MRKRNAVAIATLLLCSIPIAAARGQADLTSSKHDFTTATGTAPYNFASSECETCHIPHNPLEAAEGPLWNHEVNTGQTYTLYSNPASLDATPQQPTGRVSALCLSCHDGTVAVDNYGGNTTGTQQIPTTATTYIGTDISNDHPVSFTYDATLVTNDGELVSPSGGQVGTDNLPLYGGSTDQLECATCHDPHGAGASFSKFLRGLTNTFCANCHSK